LTETAAVFEREALAPSGELARRITIWSRLSRRPLFWLAFSIAAVLVLVAIAPGAFAGWFGHGDPLACNLADSARGPGNGHPFGFDIQGCDVYANVVYGARDSISIGLLVTALSLLVAVPLGCLAGYYGRLIDALLSRVADIFFGFPFLLGAVVILSTFRLRDVASVSVTLALFVWPVLARLMRASVLQVKQLEYVQAARSLGASDLRIIRHHILPNAIAPVIVISTITIGSVIAAEAALTFLGVGLQYPAISWGLQLAQAQTNFQQHPHLLIFPGLFLSATVFSFILLGETLQNALDGRA
jgi:oligopeptide transport system permease protein